MLRAALWLAVAGCLSVPTGKQPQCTKTSDCDTAAGEVCDDGSCWGGPPSGQFAAVVVPPSTMPDLIYTDIASEALPTDGALGAVALASAVQISGRVEAYCATPATCADTTLDATVTVTRPARFAGGPSFSAVATSKGGLARGIDSFQVAVPPTAPGDLPFTITVAPDSSGDAPPDNGTTSPAELAPPAQISTTAAGDTEVGTITLGSETSPVLTGTIVDANGQPLTKYRVVALGKLGQSATATEVSTVDFSTDGTYAITLADGVSGPVTLEALPYDTSVTAPTLYATDVADASGALQLVQPDAIGDKLAIAIPITGLSGGGAVVAIAGAHVTVSATYAAAGADAHAVLEADTETGSDGLAAVALLDGAAFATGYTIQVIPPASSELGIYEATIDLSAIGSAGVRLPPRLALSGQVVDANGDGVGSISVTAEPSLRFQWDLDSDGQSFLAQIPAPSTVTDSAGAFTLWVDPMIEQAWGYYDLDFSVPQGIAAASWTHSEIAIPHQAGLAQIALGNEPLPATAFMHGTVAGPGGGTVAGGELRIFQIETDTSLCSLVEVPPDPCAIPAVEIGDGTSADDGTLQLALPRDPAAP